MLQSLQACTTPLAALVVDNADDPATEAVIAAAQEKMEAIRLVPGENLGCGGGLAYGERYALEHFGGRVAPVLGLTPLVAGILAKAGYSKAEVKRWIYERALIPAKQFDEQIARIEGGYDLQESVKRGKLPERFAESDDPERRVPVLHDPEELQIVVCGAANRNRSFIAGQFGKYGWDVSRQIRLPAAWKTMLARTTA